MERLSRRNFLKVGSGAALGSAIPRESLVLPELYIVQGAIIGKNEVGLRWIIDSGAQLTIVQADVAKEAGLEWYTAVAVKGVKKEDKIPAITMEPVAKIKQLWAYGWSLQYDIDAIIMDMSHFGQGVGVLGLNFLKNPECMKQ